MTHNQDCRVAIELLLIVRLGLEPLDELVPHQKRVILDGYMPFRVGPTTVGVAM